MPPKKTTKSKTKSPTQPSAKSKSKTITFTGPDVSLSGRRAAERYGDITLAALADIPDLDRVWLGRQKITRIPPMRPQVTRLALSACHGLTALTGIEALSGLTDVSLEELPIDLAKEIPRLAELPDLATLELDVRGALPSSLAKLPSLSCLKLTLHDRADFDATFAVLATCSTLRTLALTFAKPMMLPKAIGTLTQVRSLALYDPSELCDELCDLVALEALEVHGDFRAVPDRLGELVNLRTLELDSMKIKKLPDIGGLTVLRVLDLSPWKKIAVTDSFFTLKLDKFSGPSNLSDKLVLNPPSEPLEDRVRIADSDRIPPSFGDPLELRIHMRDYEGELPQLDTLVRVAEVQLGIANLADAIPRLVGRKYLRTLKLDGMYATLPETLGDLVQLETLEIGIDDDDGQLTAWPKSITKLANLKSLALGANQMTKLPAALGELVALETLAVGGDKLTALPAEIGRLSKLAVLRVTRTAELTELPPQIAKCTALREVELGCSGMAAGDLVVLAKLPALRDLELGGEPTRLATLLDAFEGHALETLRLRAYGLKSLPKAIGGLANLRRLELGGTQIETVPDDIAKCTELRYISFPYGAKDAVKAKLPPGRWKKGDRSHRYWYERTD